MLGGILLYGKQLLMSVYNPNRLEARITGGHAIFKHDHQPIGYAHFPSVTAHGGSVTDVSDPRQHDLLLRW